MQQSAEMVPQALDLLLTPDDLSGFYACPELAFPGFEHGVRLRLERVFRPRLQEIRAVTTWALELPDAGAARRSQAARAAAEGSPFSLPRSYSGVRAWVRPRPAEELIEYRIAFRQGRLLAEISTESRWLIADAAAPPDIDETLRLARLFARKLSQAQGQHPRRARFGRASMAPPRRLASVSPAAGAIIATWS